MTLMTPVVFTDPDDPQLRDTGGVSHRPALLYEGEPPTGSDRLTSEGSGESNMATTEPSTSTEEENLNQVLHVAGGGGVLRCGHHVSTSCLSSSTPESALITRRSGISLCFQVDVFVFYVSGSSSSS
ncbi:unnamed protein product [Pleuronectes platessa]|uniref:Uncharacterized protein n=1 Tax=Pleuronectes platessa TaxID=8262 RepID=A0A9N7USR5_PLEPL|nr:unnamed protein product [Pleuronectes platessa]